MLLAVAVEKASPLQPKGKEQLRPAQQANLVLCTLPGQGRHATEVHGLHLAEGSRSFGQHSLLERCKSPCS